MFLMSTVVVIALLMWSVNQTTNARLELDAADERIGELSRQILELRDELALRRAESFDGSAAHLQTVDPFSGIPEMSTVSPDSAADGKENPEEVMNNRMAVRDLSEPESQSIAAGTNALASLNYTEAIEHFEEVRSSEREFETARLGIADAYFYSQQYRSAIAEYTNILNIRKDSVRAAVGLANAYGRVNEHQKQIKTYDRIISLQPGHWLHYNGRATAYLLQDEDEKALEDYLKAVKLASPDKTFQAAAMENIGLIYLRRGQWLTALQHSTNVNRLDRKQAWNWLIRGIAAAKLKRNVDAYIAYDEWFKYRRATDPYLLKQYLPEDMHQYIDVDASELGKLVNPPLISGEKCDNNFQCKSLLCRPGPPDNKFNYCVAADKHCAAHEANGFNLGEFTEINGIRYRCYEPINATGRWTRDLKEAEDV